MEIGSVRSGLFHLTTCRSVKTVPRSSMGQGAKSKHCEQVGAVTISAAAANL
jgi:hypothetical protein